MNVKKILANVNSCFVLISTRDRQTALLSNGRCPPLRNRHQATTSSSSSDGNERMFSMSSNSRADVASSKRLILYGVSFS